MTRLVETVYQESAPERVDESAGILYGVKVLGEVSKNGRRYTPEAQRKAVSLYNERKGYANHPGRKEASEDRKLQDWTTVFRNSRYVEGSGIHADAHLLKSDPLFPKIIEAAQRFPKSIGFSHVADGESRRENGIEIVESIKEVFSVDLVSDPATTNGMFESVAKKPESLQEFIGSIPESIPQAQRTRLIEAMSAAWPTVPGVPGAAADPQAQIMTAFQSMLAVVLDVLRSAMDNKDQAAKSAAEAEAAKKAAEEKAAADKAATPPAEKKEEPPTVESLQREMARLQAKTMLLESGRAASDQKARDAQIEALANIPSDKRQSLLESWPVPNPKLHESRPFDSLRPASSPPANSGGPTPEQESKLYESRFEETAKAARDKLSKRAG